MSTSSRSAAPSSIVEAIEALGGRVTFARFMELALTHPTLGYYSRVDRLLWYGGDFTTAPAISPFFNRTVAKLVTELVDASLAAPGTRPVQDAPTAHLAPPRGGPAPLVPRPCVIELGGGEGQLAHGILGHWERERPEFVDRVGYRIVEVGTRLRERQSKTLENFAGDGWDLGWGADLSEACISAWPVVVLGNEFLDALPVHVVDTRGTVLLEEYVSAGQSTLALGWGDVSDEVSTEIESLFGTLDPQHLEAFTEDGILEVSPGVGELLRRVAEAMPSGSMVNVDYGEWFPGVRGAPGRWGLADRKRRRRSVRGYFRHQMVLDPLVRPGRQDLTADVDFAAVDLHGSEVGFETVLYTTLAGFLRGGGAEEELEALGDASTQATLSSLEADRQATVLDNLLDEEDLGDAFKVMVQVRE